VAHEANLLDVLNAVDGLSFDAPCGGNGTCGKCRVRVVSGAVSPVKERERRFLKEGEIADGIRLACMTLIEGDAEVSVPDRAKSAKIMTDNAGYQGPVDPQVKKTYVELPCPSLEDQRDDVERIRSAAGAKLSFPLRVRRGLPCVLRDGNFRLTLTSCGETAVAAEPGDTRSSAYGIAVDIGTTTVVSYLLDLVSGRVIDAVSGLNHQKVFGGDVISRIDFSFNAEGGLGRLSRKITEQLAAMAKELLERNSLSLSRLYSYVIAGNTTMIHLFAGIDPRNIAASPFIPVCTDLMTLEAEAVGLPGEAATVFVLPSMAGYVGADIVAGILSTGLAESEDLCLLLDIGTNGEIVLGSRDGLLSCSTAAGPAFEGANISRGVGGIAGAVNTVAFDGAELSVTTIGNEKAIGICGSGIIDAAAILVRTGAADYTGRIIDREEAESDAARAVLARLSDAGGEPSIVIAAGSETEDGDPILFTQKDLREIQLAKAAIAAGIKTLVREAGRSLIDVQRVFLAGGFGSYIRKESALAIGLLPAEFADRIEVVGNSAGLGAIMASLSRDILLKSTSLKAKSRYVELSGSAAFQDEYIESMYFA
jgi:uncharacterized 2Fe-2S/4Fe-4S cluster protein (DUF4445 family)